MICVALVAKAGNFKGPASAALLRVFNASLTARRVRAAAIDAKKPALV